MSADNGIYILVTYDKFKRITKHSLRTLGGDKRILAYRVAHTQAVDNFDWYIENELHNLGEWMQNVFGKAPLFYSYSEAFKAAELLHKKVGYTEYGICTIAASEYNFPGF